LVLLESLFWRLCPPIYGCNHYTFQLREEKVDMATFDDFIKLDIRVGTVIKAEFFAKAKVPAIKLEIDFGPEIGMKRSSAQITKRYTAEAIIGRQVVAVVNFPPRRIAGFDSEVLVLGGVPGQGDVVLLRPDEPLPNGTPIA